MANHSKEFPSLTHSKCSSSEYLESITIVSNYQARNMSTDKADADKTDVTELVPVAWSGKKLFIEKTKLDEWYEQSYEQHDAYAKEHPWAVQRIAVHDFSKDKAKQEANSAKNTEMSDYVVVHWSGKSLLLKRSELDIWYKEGPEERREFVRLHPDVEIDFSKPKP